MAFTKLVVPRSEGGLIGSPHFVVWNIRDMFNVKALEINLNLLEVNYALN